MGSAKVYNAKPQPSMADDKRTLKKFFKTFFKKDKKKDKIPVEETEHEPQSTIASKAVENILEKLNKLELRNDDEELEHFSRKTVKDERSDSHTSEDSGFAEKLEHSDEEKDTDDDVIVSLKQLSIDEGKTKEKRVQTVVVSRQPIRPKINYKSAPYSVQQNAQDPSRQINQVNRNTLTGGHVLVNRNNDFLEVDAALNEVLQTSQNSQYEHGDEWFSIVSEVIQEDSIQKETTVEDILSEFFQSQQFQEYQPHENEADDVIIMTPPHQTSPSNPIEEFQNHLQSDLFGEMDMTLNAYEDRSNFIFPTPPHSENAASPMSEGSCRTSEYIYSPERSSPISNSDYEKFQVIPPHEEEDKIRDRNPSTASMTMKQYKDLQKEISQSFSKKDCCQITRKPCKQMFQEYMKKIKLEDRKELCLKVTKMDLKHAYGVLQNILISLSRSDDLEDMHHALFCLIGERVLAQNPEWYVEDFGLNLLKSAVLRCPKRPLLTRYLVQCVRTAIKANPSLVEGKESVFHEVDAQGDTLLTACARQGDVCADVLAELVRDETLPLFRVHHVNADGASALHVACSEHGASSSRLRVVHVLLEHAHADLWQGDSKAGDTPVHMAVNSKSCDLNLVMVLFRHVDRKQWKKLAHAPNMCSTTPLEYARSAAKSQVRDGYPAEVLEFLKKCR